MYTLATALERGEANDKVGGITSYGCLFPSTSNSIIPSYNSCNPVQVSADVVAKQDSAAYMLFYKCRELGMLFKGERRRKRIIAERGVKFDAGFVG